jgi:apolipoprotein N-acyltransferase
MIKETLAQALISFALLGFSVLIGLTGIGFLVAGLYLGLTHWLEPAVASAATGFIILLATVMLLLICKAVLSPAKKPVKRTENTPPDDNLAALLQDAAALRDAKSRLESTIREHRPLITATTFAAGFYLGVNPQARHSLGQALSEASAQHFGKGHRPSGKSSPSPESRET